MNPNFINNQSIAELRHILYFHVDRLCHIGAEFWVRLAAIGLILQLTTKGGIIFTIIATAFLSIGVIKCAGRLIDFFKKPCLCGKHIAEGESVVLGIIPVICIWFLGIAAAEGMRTIWPRPMLNLTIAPLICAFFFYIPILTLPSQSEENVSINKKKEL